jgi:hypothetical protein
MMLRGAFGECASGMSPLPKSSMRCAARWNRPSSGDPCPHVALPTSFSIRKCRICSARAGKSSAATARRQAACRAHAGHPAPFRRSVFAYPGPDVRSPVPLRAANGFPVSGPVHRRAAIPRCGWLPPTSSVNSPASTASGSSDHVRFVEQRLPSSVLAEHDGGCTGPPAQVDGAGPCVPFGQVQSGSRLKRLRVTLRSARGRPVGRADPTTSPSTAAEGIRRSPARPSSGRSRVPSCSGAPTGSTRCCLG